MSCPWWMRPGAPTDDEIDSEIRSHLERIEAEEIASGCAADEARCRARERFGDETVIADAMRRAWVAPPLSMARTGLLMVLAMASMFVLFALNAVATDLARGGTIATFLLLLPSAIVLVIPLGAAAGAAIVGAGSRFALRRRALDRALVSNVVRVSAVAMVATFLVYLAVPASNTRYVHALWQRSGGQQSTAPLNPRLLDIPTLLTIGDTARQCPDVAKAWTALPSFQRDRLAVLARFELQKRLVLPFSCVAFALFGLACGASFRRLRFAPALGVIGALGGSGLWFAIYVAAEARLEQHPASVALLAWLPNIAVLLLAVAVIGVLRGLDVRAPDDSQHPATS